eukprot:355645-Chlamydomonas_euryale.AAC.38
MHALGEEERHDRAPGTNPVQDGPLAHYPDYSTVDMNSKWQRVNTWAQHDSARAVVPEKHAASPLVPARSVRAEDVHSTSSSVQDYAGNVWAISGGMRHTSQMGAAISVAAAGASGAAVHFARASASASGPGEAHSNAGQHVHGAPHAVGHAADASSSRRSAAPASLRASGGAQFLSADVVKQLVASAAEVGVARRACATLEICKEE